MELSRHRLRSAPCCPGFDGWKRNANEDEPGAWVCDVAGRGVCHVEGLEDSHRPACVGSVRACGAGAGYGRVAPDPKDQGLRKKRPERAGRRADLCSRIRGSGSVVFCKPPSQKSNAIRRIRPMGNSLVCGWFLLMERVEGLAGLTVPALAVMAFQVRCRRRVNSGNLCLEYGSLPVRPMSLRVHLPRRLSKWLRLRMSRRCWG